MGKSLVIVESPAKAKTINKYLGSQYVVKSSIGHIRDLPTSCLLYTSAIVEAPAPVAAAPVQEGVEPAKKKLSYKLQRELEAIPGRIDGLEQEMAAVQEQVSDPAFYQQPVQVTTQVLARLESLQKEMDELLERWAELEG